MRTIDADELQEEYKKQHDGKRSLLIDVAPTVEPQRMRGRWNELKPQAGGYWQCSACGFPSEAFAAAQLYKFCPNCGADMRN